MRADSGFYAHAVVAVCRKLGALLDHDPPAAELRRLIEAIPEAGWTPIEYWLARADVAETRTPRSRASRTPRRG